MSTDIIQGNKLRIALTSQFYQKKWDKNPFSFQLIALKYHLFISGCAICSSIDRGLLKKRLRNNFEHKSGSKNIMEQRLVWVFFG